MSEEPFDTDAPARAADEDAVADDAVADNDAPLRPRPSVPSFVPRSPEDGLHSALDALQPSILPAAPAELPEQPQSALGIDEAPVHEVLDTELDAPQLGVASTILSHQQTYDPGAQAAALALSRRDIGAAAVAYDPSAERARAELLSHLADERRGRAGAERLCAAAAEQWQRLAEHARAATLFARAHAENDRDVYAVRELRKQAVVAGNKARAAELCAHEEQLALSNEERASLCLLRAEIERARGDHAAAEPCVHEALHTKKSVSALLALSELHRRKGRAQQAATALLQATELWSDPKARGALYLRAASLLEQAEQISDARVALSRAQEEDPALLDAGFRHARSARAAGDTQAALLALERVSQQLHGQAAQDLLRLRAQLIEAQGGSATEALRLLSSARREIGLRLRARVAERANAFDDRRAALEHSADLAAGSERVLSLIGLCELHAGRGDLEAARETLREASQVDRDSPLVRTMQADLMRASEAPAAARFTRDDAEAEEILAAAARAAKDPRAGEQELALLSRAALQNRSAELIALDLAIELRQWDDAARRFASEVDQAPSAALRLGMELARRELREAHADAVVPVDADAAWHDDSALSLAHRINRATRPAEQGALWLTLAAEMRGETAAAFATLAGDFLTMSGSGREAYERALAATPGYAPACWSLERTLANPDDLPSLRRLHGALARTTSDPLERASRELRIAELSRGDAGRETALPPPVALTTPSDVLHCDRALSARKDGSGAALAELLEGSGRSAHGPLAAVAKLRAAALHEDLGEPARAAVLYREVLDVSRGADAHAALGLSRTLDDAGMSVPLFEHLERAALSLSSVSARRDALEDLASSQTERGAAPQAAATFRTLLEFDPQHIGALRARERDAMERADLDELAGRAERLSERVRDRNERAAQLRLCARARKLLGQPMQLLAADAQLGLWHALEIGYDALGRDKPAIVCASWLELGAHMKSADEQLFCALRAAEALERVSPERAVVSLAPHIGAAPQHPIAHETLARLRQAAHDAEGAAHDFEQAAAAATSHKRRARLWYRAAVLWQDTVGNDVRATRALRAVVALDVLHQDSFERLRQLLSAAADAPALADLLALRVAAGGDVPQRIALLVARAQLLVQVGQPDAARSALTQALALDPARLDALNPLAELYLADAQWPQAADTLIRIARLARDRDVLRHVFMTLGRIYTEHTPDLRRAEVAYARAGALDPDDIEALERLLYVFRSSGDHNRALRACERLISLAKNDTEVDARTIQAATVLEEMGHQLRAERALNDRREQRPTSVAMIAALTSLYTRQHDEVALRVHIDRSLHGLRAGALEDPGDGAALRELVEALTLRGRTSAAQTAAALAVDFGVADERSALLARRFTALGRAALSAPVVAQLWPAEVSRSQRDLMQWLESKGDAVLARHKAGPALAQPPIALRRALAIVESTLAPRGLTLVTEPGRSVLPLQTRPLTISIGEGLLSACDIDELTFLIVRAVAMAQLGLCVVATADRRQLDSLLHAAASPTADASAIDAKLAGRKRAELHALVKRAAADGAVDGRALQRGAWELGARVALTALGKCNAALAALDITAGAPATPAYREHEPLVAPTPGSEGHALLSFALSDTYLEREPQPGAQPQADQR